MRQIDAPDRCEVCCISKKCRYFQSKLSRSPFTKEIRDKLKSIDNQNWKTWLKSVGTFIWTDTSVSCYWKFYLTDL